LQLTLVALRSPITEPGAQDVLVPFLRPLPIGDLHIDMLHHEDLRHLSSLPFYL